MSEQNPYIVKEEEGKAATIRDFVTGVPLKPEEMLPDEHGIHPVSPLGFLNKDDGASVRQLDVHDWTSGFVPAKVDDNIEEAYLKSYVVTGKYTVLTGSHIAFPVLGITRSGNILDVTVEGTVPTDEEHRFFFRNTTCDDYTVTGLVSSGDTPDSWTADDIVHDGDRTRLNIEIAGDIQFNGIVGAGKLDMCVDTAKTYLCLAGTGTSELTGIYLPGSSDGLPFTKVYSYGEIMPNAHSAEMDLLVGYYSAAENYLEYAHPDGTFTRLWCDEDNRDYFGGSVPKVDCTVKHLTDVAMVNGLPLIRTVCKHGTWHGPYLSTLVSSDGSKWMNCPSTETGTSMSTPHGWNGCFPATLPEGDIYYKMSDAVSYDKPQYGLCNDLYLYFFNIRYNAECYASNGYSDREVADWVKGKLSPVIDYARHPYSVEGNLDGAGAFTRWFASCADTDISGGMGTAQVMVPGFGLGAGYTGTCNSASLGADDENPRLESTGWLTFGYGTKHDAFAEDVGKSALPLDWPFTEVSSATEESENNITLVRDGVDVNGTALGALAKYDECETCGGTGEVSGEECPDCCGTGYARTGKVMNRMHVCLYNDFTPSDDASGPYEDTTILKKTFINLGTPLDTDDGDEYEITVSLPNVNVDKAFPVTGAADRNQSGYYAFISQPRVYVVSGTWKFSDTLVNVQKSTSTDTTIAIDKSFIDSNGNPLADIRIKFTMKGAGYPVETSTFTGVVSSTGTTITLDGCQKATYTRGVSYSICGAAYLEDNNETLPEGSTPIGLNNARREGEGELGPDYGNGDGVQVYNRLYGASDSDIDREPVIKQSDKRQVVATVYPTVTNTFAWELAGSKKLNHLDSLMTMEAESGAASIMGKIAMMNRNILMGHQAFVDAVQGDFGLGPMEYPINIQRVADASDETDEWYSYIGRVIQVSPLIENADGQVIPESNPVRQAIRAVGMLAEDYRNARVRTAPVDLSVVDTFKKEPEHQWSDWNYLFDDQVDYQVRTGSPRNYDIETARTIRLRSLANLVSQVASNEDNTPVSPLLGLNTYINVTPPPPNEAYERVSEYHTSNPYGFSEYETTDSLRDVDCDFVNNMYGKNYVENSIAMACIRKQPSWLEDPDAVNDLLRAVEIAAIDLTDSVHNAYKIGNAGWLRTFNAFANLVSPDNIPIATGEAPYEHLTDDLVKWYGGDAYYYYWLMMENGNPAGNTLFGMIATTMDTKNSDFTPLTSFLANYVPSYGADLPVRNWDSFRIRVMAQIQDTDNPIYLTRMKWYGKDCGVDFKARYVADAFIGGNNYQDVNLNRTYVDGIAHNYSSTPYALGGEFNPSGDSPCAPLNSDTDQGAVAYIRVFMKFTFSADAGRWYCTDYRQAPVSYLTPLYGAQALEEKIDDKRIWIPSTCSNVSWKAATRMLYDDYKPLDINPAVVDDVMTERSGQNRVMMPYASVADNGLGLAPPKDKSGVTDGMLGGQSANFWSVRENLRPATGALTGTDIPSYQKNSGTGEWEHGHTGGIMSDAVLWGQYDYPTKREMEFHLPDVESPVVDTCRT